MWNIFKYEFKMHLKSVLFWVISIVALIFLFMVIYPSFGQDVELIEKIMENYPEEMLKAFGMSTALPLSSVLGYTVFIFAFIQLLIAIQAANYGFGILSVEEREFTADYLMSKPVSRVRILSAKFLAALLALLITNGFIWMTMIGSIEIFKGDNTYEMKPLLVMLSSVIFFQLVYLTFGMFVSVVLKRIRNVLSFSLGIAFGTYVLNALRAIIGGKTLGYLSPFYHFDVAYILEKGHYDLPMASISFITIGITLIGTYILYLKRDIYSL